MKLPKNSMPVERKTYNDDVVIVANVNASFWGKTMNILKKAAKGVLGGLSAK